MYTIDIVLKDAKVFGKSDAMVPDLANDLGGV